MHQRPFLNYAKLALAVSGVAALSAVSGQAAAAVYAGSMMEVTGLEIDVTDSTGGIVPAGTFTFSGSNKATLNLTNTATGDDICIGNIGSGAGGTDTCGPAGDRLNAPQSFVSGGTNPATDPGEDFYSFIGPNDPNKQFARADSIVPDAALPDFNDGVFPSSTDTKNIAEAELQTLAVDQSAQANADLGSTTAFNFGFIIGSPPVPNDPSTPPVTLSLEFDAIADAGLRIDPEAAELAQAKAEYSFVVTLRRTSGGIGEVRWAPAGNGSADCAVTGAFVGEGVTCVASDGGESLQAQRSVDLIPDSDFASAAGSFAVSIMGLLDGEYDFILDQKVSVNLNNGVPAPGVLSLLGAGLIGLGALRRRRKAR